MKNTLGARIRGLRNSKNLSQKEFGKLFNLAESTIGMYERDVRKPDYETLQIIASRFSTTREYLLSGEEVSDLSSVDGDDKSDSDKKAAVIDKITRDFPDAELMFNDLANMSADDMQDVYDYIKFKRSQKKDE